jgi:cbb3-type cytochrome oxidase subunit 1
MSVLIAGYAAFGYLAIGFVLGLLSDLLYQLQHKGEALVLRIRLAILFFWPIVVMGFFLWLKAGKPRT